MRGDETPVVTSWTTEPEGGRARGPRGLARAWVAVLVRPRRFFETGVHPGDQAPGLTFAAVVAGAFASGWLLADPSAAPGVAESVVLSGLVVVMIVGALAAPVGLHLTAAVATVSLLVASLDVDDRWFLRDRGGVSETVQVVAYASAPMALSGPPVPSLRIVCGAYAAVLLFVGLRVVHGTTPARTLVAATPPAALGYGVGYRVVAAVRAAVVG